MTVHLAPAASLASYMAPLADLTGKQFDMVVVDGHFSRECLEIAPRFERKSGVLLLDNADRVDLAPTASG